MKKQISQNRPLFHCEGPGTHQLCDHRLEGRYCLFDLIYVEEQMTHWSCYLRNSTEVQFTDYLLIKSG